MNHRKRRGERAAEPIERQTWTSSPTERRRCSQVTCDLDVHVSVQQQVLRLEVPVDDVAVVAVLHRRQNLPELPSGLHLAQPPVLRQVVCGKTVEKKKQKTGRSFHVAAQATAGCADHTLSDVVASSEQINTQRANIDTVKARKDISRQSFDKSRRSTLCVLKQVCPINFTLLSFHLRHQQDNNETYYSLKLKVN